MTTLPTSMAEKETCLVMEEWRTDYLEQRQKEYWKYVCHLNTSEQLQIYHFG